MKALISKFLRTEFVQNVLSVIAFAYIKFVYLTSSWEYKNRHIVDKYLSNNEPFIVSFWHGHLLMMACAKQWDKDFHMLISNHRDGKIISKIMKFFKISTVFGSTGKQGLSAAKNVITILKKGGIVGITPDGPRGPKEKISDGILQIARLAKADIIPFAYRTSNIKILNTWDSFRFALPFSKGIFAVGTPIEYNENLEEARKKLEISMQQAAADVDNNFTT